jgi:hypothetical protein
MPDTPHATTEGRLRDALAANGPMPPAELAALSGVSLREVLRSLDRGALQRAPAARTEARCSVCRGPAPVNGLCDDCRRDFASGTRRSAGEDRPSRAATGPARRSAFHSRR